MPRHAIALLLTLAINGYAATVYRWTDALGQTHFADHPANANARQVLGQAYPRSPLHKVSYVPDGDTVYLASGEKVRLIAINAPEVIHGSAAAEPWGQQAQSYLRHLLAGARVRVQPERETRDHYGRLLAYLYLEDGRDLGEVLLRHGMAYVVEHPPNTARVDHYLAVEREARFQRRGLWHLSRYQVISAQDAKSYIHTFRRIRGTITAVQRGPRRVELSLNGELAVSYPTADHHALEHAGLAEPPTVGEKIVVRGWLRRHDNRPTLRLRDPRQVETLSAP